MAGDAYAQVAADLIAMMREGVAPWRSPWIRGLNDPLAPHNPETGNYYRGVNRWNLSAVLYRNGWEDPRFVTYAGAKRKGGNVREGEQSPARVIFAKAVTKAPKDDAGEDAKADRFYIHRTTAVFHISQVEGVEWDALPNADDFAGWDPVEDAAHLATSYLEAEGIPLTHGGDRAYYSPATDAIRMPLREAFPSAVEYYGTLFHEIAHSTGHDSRLARKFGESFGSDPYAREELTAEIAAAMLTVTAGLPVDTLPNSAAYLRGWADRLEDDPRILVTAANAAERAAEYVAERVPDRVA